MMGSRAPLVLLLTACGGRAPKPTHAPTAKVPVPVEIKAALQGPYGPDWNEPEPDIGLSDPDAADPDAPDPDAADPDAPDPDAAPPDAPPPTLFERLHDLDGPVPGLRGYAIKRKPDARHCGGIAIITTRAHAKKIHPDDKPLIDVLAVSFPTGRAASKAKLDAFLDHVSEVGETATSYYDERIENGDALTRAWAGARVAQIWLRLASVVARPEVPADIRAGRFASLNINEFCNDMEEAAEPLVERAEAAMSECAEAHKQANGGWWDPLCVSVE